MEKELKCLKDPEKTCYVKVVTENYDVKQACIDNKFISLCFIDR